MHAVVPCPAKVNLFLAVGPKDRRGYHPIRTIFQAVGLFDTMTLEVADADSLTFSDPAIPESNTVSKALRLAREFADFPPLSIRIDKQIPSEAGLGGGSSNAAGLLRALTAMFPNRLQAQDVHFVARAVGADVPFFLVGGRAKGEGYGEQLTELPDAEPYWLVIAKPPVGCATGPAYARLDEAAYEWREFPNSDELYNDFERVAPCESLDLTERLMIHGAKDALLSGSGSAVFGRFVSEDAAARAAERLKGEGSAQVWLTRTLSRPESLQLSCTR